MIINLFLFVSICFITHGYKIEWDNSVNDIDFNSIDDVFLGRIDKLNLPNSFFIYPGTKWCGAGNIAVNESDLGTEKETDKCCRQHDLCPDIIEGYQTKYNLTNPNFYTRLNCDCDVTFYDCLKSVKRDSAQQIGHIYFTVLGTQCFKNEYPIIGCQKYTYFPKKKCVQYEIDDTKDKQYQWFDLQNF
ncbi:phospholipase A2-like [Diorhabda sublineata]|uniref:phospholipase A2-like n=1 Tax=Diorhabda sublineata TaxID=1163346 RepID=UPI0024E079C4|nr:phospholipase A2-like [Diorhabda sublineata]